MTLRGLLCILLACAPPVAQAWEFRGELGLEGRYFPEPSPYVDWRHNGSAYFRGELYHTWNDRDDIFTFIPYARVDEHDDNRTHGDIRELSWIHVGSNWETRVGVRKVFWGVTEGRHLVDIINQTDAVDQVDGEEKLGQPMINLSLLPSWGTVDLFVLPGFRERTFPGEDGRPRLPIPVDGDEAEYESAAEQKRVDFAARWQGFVGDLEVAVSHFSGTSREPLYDFNQSPVGPPPTFNIPSEGLRLIPVYNVIDQTGLELLMAQGGWLWKFEAMSRSGQGDRYEAAIGGFEYTQVGIFDSAVDLGWIAEYLWEEDRDTLAASPFEHDWLLGNRLTFNDVSSTEVLWSVIYDPHSEEKAVNLESSRRFGSRFKATLEARVYTDTGEPPTVRELIISGQNGEDVFDGKRLTPYADDDFVQAELVYYF
jgi:hypothetical protein